MRILRLYRGYMWALWVLYGLYSGELGLTPGVEPPGRSLLGGV